VGLITFPSVSNSIYLRNASTATQEYMDSVNEAEEQVLEMAWDEAVTYNKSLEGNPVKDPFLAESGMVMAENYTQVLNLNGDGIMGYVSMPVIDVKLPIYHGTADDVLRKGIGHLEGSSLPVGGTGSHCVLTGHTGEVHAKLFTDLSKVKKGDIFFLYTLDQTLAYEVDQIITVDPDDVTELRRSIKGDYCTLVTCTPYGVNTHRLFVRGVRVEYSTEVYERVISQGATANSSWFYDWNTWIGIIIGAVVALVIALILVLGRKKTAKNAIVRRGGQRRIWDELLDDAGGG